MLKLLKFWQRPHERMIDVIHHTHMGTTFYHTHIGKNVFYFGYSSAIENLKRMLDTLKAF